MFHTPKNANSSFFESLVSLTNALKIEQIEHKLMRHAVLFHLENSMIKYSLAKDLSDNNLWQEFLKKYRIADSGIDTKHILIHTAAQMLQRNIIILHEKDKHITFNGGNRAEDKPALVMVRKRCDQGQSHFSPIFQKATHPI